MILPAATVGLAATIPESGSITSSIINALGFSSLSVGLKSTQAGQVSVQCYLDGAAQAPQGAPVSATLTANTAAYLTLPGGSLLFSTFVITVTNTSGSAAATLSNVAVLIG